MRHHFPLTTLFPRLVDRLLETDQDCLGCPARLPSLLVDSAPRVPALADLEVENQGGVEDPHQDRRDQRGQTSPRSHPQTAEDGRGKQRDLPRISQVGNHESVIPYSTTLPQLVRNADLVRTDSVDHYWVHRVCLCLLPDGDQRE